ncbi:MAG TPA: protein translocase subunit SecF [Candidatus Polarisedimenticolaceae bacterium]
MFEFFHEPKFDFVGKTKIWAGVSIAMVVLAVAVLSTKGLHKGIEFTGGTEVQVQYASKPDIGAVRAILERSGFTGAVVTSIGKAEENEVYIRVPLAEGSAERDISKEIVTALQRDGAQLALRGQSYIGPVIGEEIVTKAMWAIFGSLAGMLVYIWIRFEFQWGAAAVIALVHDTIVTLGMFSLFDFEMSLPVVAAFLTLIGYSVNDTVVVFDRVRENIKLRGGELPTLRVLINDSLNQTLSRTMLTSSLTWICCLSLFFLGGPALRDFSIVLVMGIVIGTYSSIYVASPVLVAWREWISRRATEGGKTGAAAPAKPAARKVRTSGKA